jgi:hypothetical protein
VTKDQWGDIHIFFFTFYHRNAFFIVEDSDDVFFQKREPLEYLFLVLQSAYGKHCSGSPSRSTKRACTRWTSRRFEAVAGAVFVDSIHSLETVCSNLTMLEVKKSSSLFHQIHLDDPSSFYLLLKFFKNRCLLLSNSVLMRSRDYPSSSSRLQTRWDIYRIKWERDEGRTFTIPVLNNNVPRPNPLSALYRVFIVPSVRM